MKSFIVDNNIKIRFCDVTHITKAKKIKKILEETNMWPYNFKRSMCIYHFIFVKLLVLQYLLLTNWLKWVFDVDNV